MTTYSLPCPNGCAQTIAARGDDIHACAASAYDEYLACHDGAIIARAANNSDAALALDTYMRLAADPPVLPDPLDDPLEPEESGVRDDAPIIDPDAQCQSCGGAHHIQRCPEIWAAMRAPDHHTVAAGRAIFRHFGQRPRHFVETLRRLDPSIWHALAGALVAYRGGAVEDVLTSWWLAATETAQIPADYRRDLVVHPIVRAADASAGAIEGTKTPA